MPHVSYAEFCQQALYGPQGYYNQVRQRVGRNKKGDFYTSCSIALFPRLLAGAFAHLARQHKIDNPALVELGNEPGAALFPAPPSQSFSASQQFPLGTLEGFKPAKVIPQIVFCNELFDAQPFNRYRFSGLFWQELGIDFDNDTDKIQFDVPWGKASSQEEDLLGKDFPLNATVDISLAAIELIEKITSPSWNGLFVAFDYGLSLAELRENPRATARAYHQHQQLSLEEAINKLKLPMGSYDITHHVIWDHLAGALSKNGFRVEPIMSQEAFFVKYAADIFPSLNQEERRQLATLLHPSNMGQKFQVLIAVR